VSKMAHAYIKGEFSVILIPFIPFHHWYLFLERVRCELLLPCKSLVVWVEEAGCQACGAFSLGERIVGNRFPYVLA
jgi:hypothetical protein